MHLDDNNRLPIVCLKKAYLEMFDWNNAKLVVVTGSKLGWSVVHKIIQYNKS